MRIRFAKLGDTKAILTLGESMWAESRFKGYAFNPEKTQSLIKHMLTNQPATDCILLAETNQRQLVGMLAGHLVDFFFSDGSLTACYGTVINAN